ncbi:hypothetical protein [Streptomyces boncukensis]|uniref:Uncharacterized protein n=1 Tax=Streptomyces boncukensis TaxID=2711219 RepID=A0A6G4WT90_9ACTN|nr:hypothetical protein [Streptomyces boncukensis]NGO67860.1 hypothetical protein [Streptomyces boncukensis]
MSHAAHLYPVPDPDDEPSPGDKVAPVDTEQAGDVGESDADNDEVEDVDGEPRRRALTLPDLSPYYDVRPLAELGPLAAAVARRSGPPLRRGVACVGRALARVGRVIAAGALCLCRGLCLLLVLFVSWLSGQVGRGGSIPARLAITTGALYVLATAPAQHPAVPYAMAAGFLLALIAAGTGRIPEPGSKKKGKKLGEKGKPTGENSKGDAAAEATPPEGEDAEKDGVEDATRARLFGRLRGARKKREVPPGEACDGSPAPVDETTPEVPVEPPLTALIRREIGAENGVHLADLRPAMRLALPGLAEATDKELREVLEGAGWDPSKTFRARGHAGRAGVHRNQLPPLPSPDSPQEGAEDRSPASGERPRPANSSEAENSGERTGEWSNEDRKRGFRMVRDPERGPSAWKVEHHKG